MLSHRVRITDLSPIDLTMADKTVVFAGGTSGIGRDAVLKLAALGADVHILGRDEHKLDELQKTRIQPAPWVEEPGQIHAHIADFADLTSVRSAAATLKARQLSVNLLVNCVGSTFPERQLTCDGLEQTWAVNHIGPFLLTHLLLPQLAQASPTKTPSSRVIQVSSATARNGTIHADVSLSNNWASMRAYAQAKLAINMSCKTWSERVDPTKFTVNALHPGWIDTELGRGTTMGLPTTLQYGLTAGARLFAKPIYVGANAILTLALARHYEGVTGEFIMEDKIAQPHRKLNDDELRHQVWELSCQDAGVSPHVSA